jgi:hypothetical protein
LSAKIERLSLFAEDSLTAVENENGISGPADDGCDRENFITLSDCLSAIMSHHSSPREPR